jgi:hypothetical protein
MVETNKVYGWQSCWIDRKTLLSTVSIFRSSVSHLVALVLPASLLKQYILLLIVIYLFNTF